MSFARVLLMVSIPLFSFNATSQVSIGVGGGAFLYLEEYVDKEHYGGEMYVKTSIQETIRFGLNFGIYVRQYDFSNQAKASVVSSPISLLAEYVFLRNKFRPYLGIHAGALLYESSLDYPSTSFNEFAINFLISPVAGAEYDINESVGVNLNIKYGLVFYNNDITGERDMLQSTSANLGVFYKF